MRPVEDPDFFNEDEALVDGAMVNKAMAGGTVVVEADTALVSSQIPEPVPN